jgi:peptidoglycan/LPS O-acetylase OafA/YrhL
LTSASSIPKIPDVRVFSAGRDLAEGGMNRELVLKVVRVLVGVLFSAAIYPLTMSLWKMNKSDYGDDMMFSLYFALGIFLLMAVRNPSANRSLIAFAAWSSFAIMAVLAVHNASERPELLTAVAVLVLIGVALIALAPAKQSPELVPAAAA